MQQTTFPGLWNGIREDDPAAALPVARVVYRGVASLQKMPNRGRIGRVADTHELIFSPWPYIAVYEIIGDTVQVLRIRHAAQNWP